MNENRRGARQQRLAVAVGNGQGTELACSALECGDVGLRPHVDAGVGVDPIHQVAGQTVAQIGRAAALATAADFEALWCGRGAPRAR